MVIANLANFPLLLSLNSDSDLANNTQDDGDDIVFIDDSNNQLYHEIEYYDNSTGNLVCWININSIFSTEDTALYIYYGNPTSVNQQNVNEVWDSHYVMVQHLNEVNDTHYDSTSYGNDGLPQGGLNQNIDGKIDGADLFDGTDDFINCGNDSSLNISEMLTVEAWVNYTDGSNCLWRGIVTKNDYMDWAFAVGGDEAPGKAVIYITGADGNESGDVISTSIINDGIWHHIVATYNGSVTRIYVDGFDEANSTTLAGEIHTSDSDLFIGTYEAIPQLFEGGIDEIRVSNIARSDDWIKTQYNNQNYPTTFLNIDDQETFNMKPTADYTYLPENPSIEDTIQFADASIDPDGEIVSWFWDFDDGNTSIEQSPAHQYALEGTYIVSLNVTDDEGATDEISKEIIVTGEVNKPPSKPVINGNTSGEVGEELIFTLSATDPEEDNVSYEIEWGDGTTTGWTEYSKSGVEIQVTHSWSKAGKFNVKARAKDTHGDVSEYSKIHEVNISDIPAPPLNLKIKLKVISIGKVKATIENQGENVSELNWSITVKRFRLIQNRRTVAEVNGKITNFTAGSKIDISTGKRSIRFKFGLAKVTITAESEGQQIEPFKQRVLILGRIILARPKLLGI
jgi:PKD repeat protein